MTDSHPEMVITTSGASFDRVWQIRVDQISCGAAWAPPPDCAQHHTGVTGNFRQEEQLFHHLIPLINAQLGVQELQLRHQRRLSPPGQPVLCHLLQEEDINNIIIITMTIVGGRRDSARSATIQEARATPSTSASTPAPGAAPSRRGRARRAARQTSSPSPGAPAASAPGPRGA